MTAPLKEALHNTFLALLLDHPRAAKNPKQVFRSLKEAGQPTYSLSPHSCSSTA